MKVDFYRHSLGIEELNSISEALGHPILTTGSIVHEFENMFMDFTNNKFIAGTMSCTHSLELAMILANIKNGDEVITTPMTFIASTNSIEKAGGVPVFVDVEESTGNINADLIENAITNKTKAILVVHLYGVMCDMVKIRSIADKYNLIIIEDSAHCIEGMREGFKPGNLGDYACFSFYATKNLTCGEGGAISVKSKEDMERIKVLYLHGMDKSAETRFTEGYKHWNMNERGIKANMSNIQASILIPQLSNINNQLEKREKISKNYENSFENISGIRLLEVPKNSVSARHLFTILVNPKYRDQIITNLQDLNIGVTVNYRAVHLLNYYKSKYIHQKNQFPNAELIGDSTISIPLYPSLSEEEQTYVIDSVINVVRSYE